MTCFKKHGNAPFNIAVIHGGPGAAGGVRSFAERISELAGTLEPLQTKTSINGQVEELKAVLQKNTDLPITLIGHSWGAWLSFIFAAKYPAYVRKLILVGSGPFEAKYAANIMKTRMERLSENDKETVNLIREKLNNSEPSDAEIAEFTKLMTDVDSYRAISYEKDQSFSAKIFREVWEQAEAMRKSGQLLNLADKIKCPVIAIHGDYDPHPYKGVKEPLSRTLKDFKFFLLKKCGHTPWIEKYAKDKFYEIIYKQF